MASQFKIDGAEYAIPSYDTFTLDESIVLENYSGLTLDELEDMEGLRAGVLAGLLHVAIARANPDMKVSEVKRIVKTTNVLGLLRDLQNDEQKEEEETPEVPPTLPESSV